MGYIMERYRDCRRFNEQYEAIHQFLLEAEKLPHNEHFHWGRMEWMHCHSYLETEKLTEIVLFRQDNGEIVGLLAYDTVYDDRTYLIHTSDDPALLGCMTDAVIQRESGKAVIKANSKDTALCRMLQERGFRQKHKEFSVLALDLTGPLPYTVPEGYSMSPRSFVADPWQYQLVIHRGFDNPGIPEKWEGALLSNIPHKNAELQTFILAEQEYCAHCGIWYTAGDTAYVEPVVTVPQHRKRGLAKAAVYEACGRVRALGAKRATVLSDQEFYLRIGFAASSEVYCWERQS